MIFNLFKSKPTLSELIPKGFVDIHSHILPGIDDGAKNIEESMELISKMKKMGICKIIGTPHTIPGLYNNNNNTIKRSFELLKKNINIDIELDYASEYMIDYSLINKAEQKLLLPIKENYVLIEMSYISKPINLYDIILILVKHKSIINSKYKIFKKIKNNSLVVDLHNIIEYKNIKNINDNYFSF